MSASSLVDDLDYVLPLLFLIVHIFHPLHDRLTTIASESMETIGDKVLDKSLSKVRRKPSLTLTF